MRDKALALAAKGHYVFPIKSLSKQPAITGWQSKATTDPDTIAKWWSGQGYDRNIGIATEPSGLCVIDIDTKGKNGKENYQKLTDKHGYNDTFTVETPSGGAHLYYSTDSNSLRSTVSKLAEGVDTRAMGGYVVAPGSLIPEGSYREVIDLPIAPTPSWVIPLLHKQKKLKELDESLAVTLDQKIDCLSAVEYLHGVAPAQQGEGGDHHTYGICCELHDMGISISKGVELLAEHWNDRCEPSWSIEELHVKMSNAYDFAQSSPGCKSIRFQAVNTSPKIVHCVADMELDIPPRDWLIEGRLISGYVTVTVAPGGVGKSMFTMLEAVSIATGLPLTGTTPKKKGAVLIYNTEDPQDEIERRLAAICIAYKIDPKTLDNVFYASGVESPLRFAISDRHGVTATKDREVLKQIIEEHKIILTIFDPFVRTHSVDENSNVDIDLVVQQMSTLAIETGSAISVVHHMSKQNKTPAFGQAETARGASALSSAARVVTTVLTPTIEEIEELGIDPLSSRKYIRVDNAKGNMTAPNVEALWFTKESVELPNGDDVGVLKLYDDKRINKSVVLPFIDTTSMHVLELVAPFLGLGEIATDDIVIELAELVPEHFKGMGLNARKAKFLKLFSGGVGNDTYRIIAEDKVTKIEGVLPW